MKDKLKLISAMAIFGTIGIFRQFVNYPSSLIAFIRAFVGGLFLLIIYHKFSFKKFNLLLIISGILLGFNWIVLFESYRYTGVAIATICYYMEPIMLTLLSPYFFHNKLTRKNIICVFISLLGIILITNLSDTNINLFGVVLGLLAALMYTSVVIINKYLADIDSKERTVSQLLIAAIALLPYVLWTVDFSIISFKADAVFYLLIMAIIHTALAYSLYFSALNNLESQKVAIYSYIDPILAIVLAIAFLHEKLTITTIIGILLVLISTIYNELAN